MATFYRRVWRWHFWAGLVACPVLLVVAVTGAIYTFREEIEDWQNADVRFVEPVGERKALSEQLAAVHIAHPDWTPTLVTLFSDPRRSTIVQVNRSHPENGAIPSVYVNPYTAEVIADGNLRSPFFTWVLKLHRSLFAGTFGRVVVELTTSWTLVLLVSGVFLWWPARWYRVWGVWLPRLRSNPYVVFRDLHAVAGVLLAPAIALIAFTGLFFTVIWLWSFNTFTNDAGKFPRHLLAVPRLQLDSVRTAEQSFEVLDHCVTTARNRYPGQRFLIALPESQTTPLTITARPGSVTSEINVLTFDPNTAVLLTENRSRDLPAMERARLAVLPIHLGAIGGTTTKVLAFIACLVLAGLGVSGVAMWLTRRRPGTSGFPRECTSAIPKCAVIVILLLAVLLPTVGVSLMVVFLGEWFWGLIRRRWWPTQVTELIPASRFLDSSEVTS